MKYVFNRFELKYMVTPKQMEQVIALIGDRLSPDEYGETTIQSLYYDTDNYRLIRRSIERPTYKEKIRLRSYGLLKPGEKVFLELKKKAYSSVFKRRIRLTETEADNLLFNKIKPYDSQILREIEYFRDLYGNLRRSVLILYDRTAFFGDDELRVTFDKNVRYRTERLNLSSDLNGTPLITDGKILMEIKIKGGMPIWLSKILSELKIYKTRFSKYGEAYKNILKQNLLFKEKVV
ncbi:MAG: polyphosphate polymerase domain-containing protein [Clostridia bacterium]|nr:polyphosphate polymerase domain-containing protein [Clostridia bacterium]